MYVSTNHAEKTALYMQKLGESPEARKQVTGVGMSRLNSISRRQRVQINRGLVTNMLLEAYAMADTAGEIVNAAKELGKLHGLYEPEKTVTIQGTFEEAKKQISQMSSDELQQLLRADDAIEATWEPNDD